MNNQDSGTTECGSDDVPPVEVIRVEINPEILDALKEQVFEERPDLREEASPIPVDVFIALPGNRVIQVAVKGANVFVPGPEDKFAPQSLIPIAIFVGKGSQTSGTTVGSKTSFINWG